LPFVELSPDPDDNWLIALAEAGGADFLVTGDKADLLSLERTGSTRIVTARQFLDEL
jgi:predicted nucleic acid-binding protein